MITIHWNNSLSYIWKQILSNFFFIRFSKSWHLIFHIHFKSINLSPITRVRTTYNVATWLVYPHPESTKPFYPSIFLLDSFFFFRFFTRFTRGTRLRVVVSPTIMTLGRGMIEEWDGYSVSQCKLKRMAGGGSIDRSAPCRVFRRVAFCQPLERMGFVSRVYDWSAGATWLQWKWMKKRGKLMGEMFCPRERCTTTVVIHAVRCEL